MVGLLARQTNSLQDQLAQFRSLMDSNLADPATIYLGNNYFAEVSKADAKDFLQRKIQIIEKELESIHQFEGLNDEGLPVFDIVEELDENGDIIDAKKNRTGLGAQLAQLSLNKQKDNGTAGGVLSGISQDPHAPLTDGLSSLDLLSSSNDDDVQYIEDVSFVDPSRAMEDQSNGDFRDVDPADFLELELSGDWDSTDASVDFDFDNLEEDDNYIDDDDDEDDDDEDEDYGYKWSSGLFPQDEASRKLIEAHLLMNSLPYESGSSAKKSQKSAHVHFAEKIDIREFETCAEERKRTPFDFVINKPSRFKSIQKTSQAVHPHIAAKSMMSANNGQSMASAAAAAAKAVTRSPPISGSIKERDPGVLAKPITSPSQRSHGSPRSPSASTVRPSPTSPSKTPNILPKASTSPSKSSMRPSKTSSSPLKASSSPSKVTSSPSNTGNKNPIHHSSPNTNNNDDELVQLIPKDSSSANQKAKDLKAKIDEDAARIFEESFVPDEDFVKLHGTDFQENDQGNSNVSRKNESSTSSVEEKTEAKVQQPILSAKVEERPEVKIYNYNDDDNAVDMKEIKTEYQRLRQQLIYGSGGFMKTESEKAFEPISDVGEPKKLSRFKAARIS